MRYRRIENILGNDFTDNFALHNITILSANPLRPDGSGFDFHERHASSNDRLYGHEWYNPGDIISDEQVDYLLELLLNMRVRPYHLSSHPIIFNARFFRGADVHNVNPPIIIEYQIFDLDKQNFMMILFNGLSILSMGIGEVTDHGWSANERIGFNPRAFRIHEDDQNTLFEILRILESDASKLFNFNLD